MMIDYQLVESLPEIQEAIPQAFVDTPQMIYSDWIRGADEPLGKLARPLKICLIGIGISNAVAALELVKAGAEVTLLEARAEVGGRARSTKFGDGQNIAEMGAMRFSPSSDLLYHYAHQFGYCFVSGFPAPGQVPTLISYKGQTFEWRDLRLNAPPPGFEKVHLAWNTFVNEGLKKDGQEVLVSLRKLTSLLQSKNQNIRLKVVPLWQKYLDAFKHCTFYLGLSKVFGVDHEWDLPGGEMWTEEDFEKFGSLGIGCGGYGPVFERDFCYICRLVVNGLETNQGSFAKKRRGRLFPAAIQDLVVDICSKAVELGATVKLETLGQVQGFSKTDRGSSITVQQTHQGLSNKFVYDLVIIGTTVRTINVMMRSLMNYSSKILSDPTIHSINSVSMISSTKVFARVKKFWDRKAQANYPRVILSDTKASQLYTFDYGHPEYGVVLITYAWGEHSDQLAAIKDEKELYRILKDQIHDIMITSDYPDYAEYLTPVKESDIRVIHWQLEPTTLGAFTLAKPGQEQMIADAYHDFRRLFDDPQHSGVLLNGDSITFEGGWMEGALRSAMNVTSAILLKFGSLKDPNKAPINLLDRNTYKY